MTRIGVISQFYDPEVGSVVLPGAISRALVAHGHEVHVLTGFPNYPTGRLYPGYRLRPYQFESRDGVAVHRVPLIPNHDRSAVRRAANYLSFGVSAAMRWRLLNKADVWLVYSTSPTVALPAMVARTLHRRPYVLFIQDLWPDSVVESGFVRRGRGLDAIVRGLHWLCDKTYQRASAIAVTAPGMVDVLLSRAVPADRITVVPNWVDERNFRPVERDPALADSLGLSGFVVMYAGNLGDVQGLDAAIDALDLLDDLPDLTLAFVGTGVAEEQLWQRAARRSRRNIVFLGQQPAERMSALMALSDVQLISVRDRPAFHAALPSKLQAALAAGRPIVAATPGDSARLVEQAGAGVSVPPEDPVRLADAIRRMHAMDAAERESFAVRGRRFYLENLSQRVGSARLLDLIEAAAAGTRRKADASS